MSLANSSPVSGGDVATNSQYNDLRTDVLDSSPTGVMCMWPTASAPTTWLLCDASAVSRTTYAALFAIISTTYGVGDGSTTFNLPDMRGRVPIGVGTGDAGDASAHTLAGKAGAETHALTTAELAAHTHTIAINNASPGGTTNVTSNNGSGGGGSANTGSTGSGDAHNNLQPSLTLNFIIKT